MAGLSEQEREDLVAYLDGELDEECSRALEARITVDPRARAEVEALRHAWDLLDYLPRAEPSTSFTNRTLERLAIQHTVQVGRKRLTWRFWAAGLGWVAALILVGVGGFFLAGKLKPAQPARTQESAEVEEQMVRHLRVLQNKRLYEAAGDLEFLLGLDQPDLFGDDRSSGG